MADSEEAIDLLSLLGIDYDLHAGRVLEREEDDAFTLHLKVPKRQRKACRLKLDDASVK